MAHVLPGTSRRRRPPWLAAAVVLLVQLALAFALFAPAWSHPSSVLIGDQIDSGPHAWYLGWTPFALSHGQSPLTSDWIGYPSGANLAWNTPMVPLGIALTPIQMLAGPVVAFNLAITWPSRSPPSPPSAPSGAGPATSPPRRAGRWWASRPTSWPTPRRGTSTWSPRSASPCCWCSSTSWWCASGSRGCAAACCSACC
jgi:hypothetical protein